MRGGLATCMLALVLAAAACRKAEAPSVDGEATDGPASVVYSPYVLQMSTEALPFQRISMKDVGMSIEPGDRDEVYERLAMSLATALSDDNELPMSSVVLYSEDVTNPANHLACGYQQVYVDLWRPDGQERWGYSLWSGCGTENEFTHREVDRVTPDDLDGLTRSIAHALRRAVETRCFSRNC